MSGMRHLRKLVAGRSFRVMQLDGSQYTDAAEPEGSDYTDVVQLDRSEYTEVRWPATATSKPSWAPTVSNSHGRKPLFLVAIVVFLGGSALCAFAASMPRCRRASARSRASVPEAFGFKIGHSPGHALAMPATPSASL
jgi:hypothetical protein